MARLSVTTFMIWLWLLFSEACYPSGLSSYYCTGTLSFCLYYCQTFEDRVPVEEWWNCMALFNSLAPGRSGCDSKNGIFNLVLLIGIFRSFHDNALRWMPQGLTDDKSALVQVRAWCRQATSHYLSLCWLSSLSPYGVARPQWVDNHL